MTQSECLPLFDDVLWYFSVFLKSVRTATVMLAVSMSSTRCFLVLYLSPDVMPCTTWDNWFMSVFLSLKHCCCGRRFLLCASGECIKVFSTSTEECIHNLRGHTDLVTGVLINPSNHLQVQSLHFLRNSSQSVCCAETSEQVTSFGNTLCLLKRTYLYLHATRSKQSSC